MMQNEILNTSLAAVGEDIGQELGAKMVKDFQDSFPTENQWHFVGRNIIEQILNQPNCSGIRFYNGLDEVGQKTLVLVGLDCEGQVISEYSAIDTNGEYNKIQGIVADRVGRPGTKTTETSTTFDWWSAI
ncbi:hypothetical protein ACFSQD_18315 [Flavihumibacter stibioxidans]|uniref:Uncharacterized protein n=1 Tax=Flavihumibacter stibioxidans TaxID=1834163 RepID=A0ABR7MC66_9BACT|nr:hypothetical protein [Flavihumibacter stibioxidans]MBC6492633.1 hypothetical protein [Flavihumibacter stibioxidans]